MTRSRKLISIFLSMVVVLFRLSTFTVGAEDLVITNNGSGSSSEVTVQSSNDTSIQQSNNGNVDNNVDTDSDTGGNEASGNNGSNVNISTGDVDSNVGITNSLNSSQVSNECCPMESGVNVEISGNGSGSNNEVDLSLTHKISVNINQNANINNRLDGSANTGENKANDNNGNVSIDTGNITVNSRIKNGPINTYDVDPAVAGPNIFASITGNGTGSNNLITSLINDLANINTTNNANIQNHLVWDLNTGENEANGNNADVSIKTGNIFADLFIDNDPINSGRVDVGCCNNQNPPPGGENPPPPSPPSNPPTTISEILGAGGGGSSGPAVFGLSATGGLFDNPILFWSGLIMLTFGIVILGRSLPPLQSSRNET